MEEEEVQESQLRCSAEAAEEPRAANENVHKVMEVRLKHIFPNFQYF
jgi:hypothetical protein